MGLMRLISLCCASIIVAWAFLVAPMHTFLFISCVAVIYGLATYLVRYFHDSPDINSAEDIQSHVVFAIFLFPTIVLFFGSMIVLFDIASRVYQSLPS